MYTRESVLEAAEWAAFLARYTKPGPSELWSMAFGNLVETFRQMGCSEDQAVFAAETLYADACRLRGC